MTNEIVIRKNGSYPLTSINISDGIAVESIKQKEFQYLFDEIKIAEPDNNLPGILFITSYPPRECGIATYSQDLIRVLRNKFENSFKIHVCPLETENEKQGYTDEIKYVLNTDNPDAFDCLAERINRNTEIRIVMIQHEFGFF